MAVSTKRGKKRVIKKVLHSFIFVNIITQLVPCRGNIELQSKAFMNGAEDELYNSGRPFQESFRYESRNINSGILFYPPSLDYGARPVGMPFMQQIVVENADPQANLHLLSISGTSSHFHCSFFEDKLVAPLGNTTFEICFLAQNLGQIKTTLYIHSSRGSFKYHVSGEGVQNPYRIKPVLGARVPLNSSFSPIIHLYNPHDSPLQVQEVYSSGSDLHLELPLGQIEATKDLWEIPPYESKVIMKANFLGRVENNHTAFIRIKTNKESNEEMLVVPMEIEVTSSPGLFSPTEMLDFGILREFDDSVSLKLNVINSRPQTVQISNVTVEPPNEAVRIDLLMLQVKRDIFNPTPVALAVFQASKALSAKDCSGNIVVWTSGPSQKLTIPYQAQVFFGDLVFDRSLHFYSTDSVRNSSKNFSVRNLFQSPIVVFNVTLGPQAANVFSILNFSKPVLIRPEEEMVLLKVTFCPKSGDLNFVSQMTLHTNLSLFVIPLIVYNGKLQVYYESRLFDGHLNFGTLSVQEKRSFELTIINDNPTDVTIFKLHTTFASAEVVSVVLLPKNASETDEIHVSSPTSQVLLRSYHQATFSLEINAPGREGTFTAEVVVETQHELLRLPYTFLTTTGSMLIDPEKLVLRNCFPGKVTSTDLHVNSSFLNNLKLQGVSFFPDDGKFSFVPHGDRSVMIDSNRESLIGKLMFDPSYDCKEECYSTFSTATSVGHAWLLGVALNKSVIEADVMLYSRSQERWNNLPAVERISNVTMQLNTDHVQGFLFNLQAHLRRPSLINQSSVHFPLTQIGNVSNGSFVIENPSDLPLLVQIVPGHMYPNIHFLLSSLKLHLMPDLDPTFPGNKSTSPFAISSIVDAHTGANITSHRRILGMRSSPNASVIFVRPGRRILVQLTFRPTDPIYHSSVFVIRNNMSIIELVGIQGRGGLGELKLSSRKPGSMRPLTFEMSDKHVKLCDRGHASTNSWPNFSIKRTFTLHNTGHLPVSVRSFEISGLACEGFGFRVVDCSPVTLHLNESRKLDIVFTPDFTMSKVCQTLVLQTNLSLDVQFVLQANIPANIISKCSSALPRPLWEPIMFYCVIVVMGFLVVCVVVAAYYESNQILTVDYQRFRSEHAKGQYDKSKVFDLRLCSSSEPVKYSHRKASQDACSNSIQYPKPTNPAPNKSSPIGQKSHKCSFGSLALLSDGFKGLKELLFGRKSCSEPKRRNESGSLMLFGFFRFFKSSSEEKTQHKKEEVNSTQQGNGSALQRRSETESVLTFRKVDKQNRRQKQFASNKPLDLFADPEDKISHKGRNEVSNKTGKQEHRKGLLSDLKLSDRNDDSSSTTTDTSSLETDEKHLNFLGEFSHCKRDKNRQARNGHASKAAVQPQPAEETSLHSLRQKSNKDGEDVAKMSRITPKHENGKIKSISNPLKCKKKINVSGQPQHNNVMRLQSKSPPPNWDPPSREGDDLNDIVNDTSNFAKVENISPCPEKLPKYLHPLSVKPSETVSTGSPNVRSLKTATSVFNEASSTLTSISTFGGRPVAAVGATIRRPWSQSSANLPSATNPIFMTSLPNSTHSTDSPSCFLFGSSNSDLPVISHSKGESPNRFPEPLNDFNQPLEKQTTMVQKLLADRRKSLLEYQKRMLVSEKWSDPERSSPSSQQLWNDYSTYWPSRPCLSDGIGYLSPLPPRYNMFGSAGWNNLSPVEDPNWLSSSPAWKSSGLWKLGSQDSEAYAVFDPFNTLENNGNIWNPTSTGSNINNGWDISSSSSAKSHSDNK